MSSPLPAYEKLGAFYLGRPYDATTKETEPTPLLYDAKDLTTHAMCVGMTGSGKTGLCITVLEEAALDGVPALVVDLKGDLTNLMLRFPDFKPENFRPWVDEDAARRKGATPDEFAAQQAELWKNGLASWDQDGDRIRRLQAAAEVAIYTPGSEAGLPVSILASFAAPSAAVKADPDALRERISTTASSLLGLLGIDADPLKSREHILLATLFDDAWGRGEDLDLASLIQRLQAPPIDKIGVLPLESFYPAKDRFELAMTLNNLLAAPSFQSWLTGAPLDVDQMLYGADGKPRVAIFSLAHLGDAERMFFLSLLLNQTLSWMRGRPGTGSLRALLYIDEIFGYLPPVANPPSKAPLLTLLKQARAFGVGLLLATQNPVDLDYKALSNMGTWFLGRLQTERDKARVLDGLVAAQGGPKRADLERLLSGLAKRVFLLHNVHEAAPVLFQVRWAMSYLCGPLTLPQIKTLMAGHTPDAAVVPANAAAAASDGKARPVLPPDVPQHFLPFTGRPEEGMGYAPRALGYARVHFVDRRKAIETSETVALLAPITDAGKSGVDWYEAEEMESFDPERLESEAEFDGSYGDLAGTVDGKALKRWEKELADALYRSRTFELFKSPSLGLTSRPGESERDFRIRLGDASREAADAEKEKLREKYGKLDARLEEKIRKTMQRLEREKEQAKGEKLQSFLKVGTTLLGAFMGRKTLSKTNLSKAGTAMRGVGRAFKEGQDVDRVEDDLETLQTQREELHRELEAEIQEAADRLNVTDEGLETVAVKPRKSDIDVRLVALAWAPVRANGEAAWQ
jgi:hypothetical protein